MEPGTVLYEAELSQFAEDIRKWKDRYIVVKNDFAVESYENKEVRYARVTISSCYCLKTLSVLIDMLWPWQLIDWVLISMNRYMLSICCMLSVLYGSEWIAVDQTHACSLGER